MFLGGWLEWLERDCADLFVWERPMRRVGHAIIQKRSDTK